jgi:extracellular elastinolytic metalloproteinase
MTSTQLRRARLGAVAAGLLTITLVPGLTQLPAFAGPTKASPAPRSDSDKVMTLADAVMGVPDLDLRGKVRPTKAQKKAAGKLDADIRWNELGTPASILPAKGYLASGYNKNPDKAPKAARAWLAGHAGLFGLTRSKVKSLELVNNQAFADSPARAVLFRQKFGKLTPSIGSMVTVGVSRGRIAYVSSSIARAKGNPPAAKLSPVQGWLKAAASVGRTVSALDIAQIKSGVSTKDDSSWTRLSVPGFANQQQARLRALALADGSVRPVIEANVVDVNGGSALAYTLMVDAVNGKVLHRQNQVENSESVTPINGTFVPPACGPMHPFTLTDGNTRTIVAVASELNPVNDIVVKIFGPGNVLLASQDTGTSPEAATYSPGTTIPAGVYNMQVCPFATPTAPLVPPFNYLGAVSTSNEGAPSAGDQAPPPSWRFFTANPSLTSLGSSTPTNSVIGCWFEPTAECNAPYGDLRNPQAPGPWDTIAGSGVPTFTTVGNNANTHEAWASPLTPGGLFQAPVAPNRKYTDEFSDDWNNSKCDPSQLVPGGNDIIPSVTDLFVTHNQMHDYSYYLGFTEDNYNLQAHNLGRGGVAGDPEVGNAQAGAIGGLQSGLGRDNANQITLQDGVPGITNQYLFQPIAGAFYAPCTDGGLDVGIVGHEYTHAISNRMVGGPDEGLTSEQGGAMGESWGDLNAAEYQFSHGYDNGGNVWAVGVYATQNSKVAIRDFAINNNPLNYSDYGFDSTGPEVHADGEIWNGTNWTVRQALVNKWNKKYPYDNAKLQAYCSVSQTANGPRHASTCPGNRRWIQLVFDAFLLQQGATSMLDARDAMIAADRMRFSGEDVGTLWKAFAQRGMGANASVKNADDTDPVPSFATPSGKNVTVKFKGKGNGQIFVGHFEARATPVADLDKGTPMAGSVSMTPGTYEMLYVSKTHGFKRFTVKVKKTKGKKAQTVKLKPQQNYAAAASGASVIGATAGSLNAAHLIDGTEATNWGGVTTPTTVDQSKPFVAVDLAGGTRTIRRIQVSAMLTPSNVPDDGLPVARVDEDPNSGSRFTALRQFALEVCTSACGSSTATWTRVYTSPGDAFPAVLPRPVSPDLTMRSFKIPATKAAAVRLVTLQNQCTGYAGYAGEQDNDPLNDTDCKTASDRGEFVHASELQVFKK